ncbi:hypothetical protein GSF70_10240 [Flavobacteriaceae bacterium W22]|nr:hypothetical protein [Flavobacteriaceae bacterium W22]
MKKFISSVTAAVALISVVSCREIEELTTVPENNISQSVNKKVEENSYNRKMSDSTNVSTHIDEGDPQKDKIKW